MMTSICTFDLDGNKHYALPLIPIIQPILQFQSMPWYLCMSEPARILDELAKYHIEAIIETRPDTNGIYESNGWIRWE